MSNVNEAWRVVCHPIPDRSHYAHARSLRRRAIALRVFAVLVVLALSFGGLMAVGG
jgi:hypothetical protein